MTAPNTTGSISVELITNIDNDPVIISSASINYLYLIEDIHSFCVTGKISFIDKASLLEFGRITGDETLIITYGNSGDDKKYKKINMKIHKIDKLENISGNAPQNATNVELTLVDEFYYKMSLSYYSYGWKDKKATEIVKDIMKRYIGVETFVNFEGSKEKFGFFDMHYRSPTECMTWLLNRSSSEKTNTSGYLLYRMNDNRKATFEYNLTTLEALLKQKNYMEPKGDEYSYQFNNPSPTYINKIIEFDIKHVDFNALKHLSGGSIMCFDHDNKKFLSKSFTYEDALKKYTILGAKTIIPETMQISSPKTTIDGISDINMLENVWMSNWIKEYCNQQLVTFTVTGHVDRHAGGMIRVVWPSKNTDTDFLNKQYDGKFLIKSVINYFDASPTGWKQKLVCIKNGYKDSSNTKLVKSVNSNI